MTGQGGLTSREKATLSAVERRLTNAEIAAEFGISVRTVESHIASLRRKLHADSRAALINAGRELRDTAVAVPANSFVGRERQVRQLCGLLDRARWVTVVGVAGTGKTRLALESARNADRAAAIVELEHCRPDDVVGAVAKGLGVTTDRLQDPVDAIDVVLAGRPYLLVLDNADRVAAATRVLVRRFLAAVPSLVVLVTSRSPLGDGAETVFPLQPLEVDGPDAASVRLFADRAAHATPGLGMSRTDLDVAARVCARLGGLPLAIELAAARTRHLTLPELEARLADGLDAVGRSGDGRHDTLEAAFAWTWDLLNDDERRVLARLAALPRTFDLDLAEAAGGPGAGRIALRLLDRSLVVPVIAGGPANRFRILDVVRHFVLARTPREDVADVAEAHATFHAGVAALVSARARLDDSPEAVELADRLCPEVSSAVTWAVRTGHDLARTLVHAMSLGVEQYGPEVDAIEALALAARDERLLAAATAEELYEIGTALCYADLDLVAELADRALDRIDGPAAELAAHHLAGQAAGHQGRTDDALAHLARAERLAVELGDDWHLGGIHQAAGTAYRGRSDAEEALAEFAKAIDAFARAGDAMHVNNVRYMMAATALAAGRPAAEVITLADECLDYAREKGNSHELAHALLARASALPWPEARTDVDAAASTFRSVGDLRCLARSYRAMADGSTGGERTTHLRQALDVAGRLHDPRQETSARAALVTALWEDGDRRGAAMEFGALAQRVGDAAATDLCVAAVAAGLETGGAVVAEGRARVAAGS